MTGSSLPLFGDDRDPDKDRSLVALLGRDKPANPEQRRFHKLVGQIERKREELKDWQAYAHRYAQRVTKEFEPLRLQLSEKRRQMAFLIDELLSQRLRRTDRATLQDLLGDLLDGLLREQPDETLAALHAKHFDPARKEKQRRELQLTEDMLQDVFGVQLDENHGAESVEELLDHAQRKMDERAQEPSHRKNGRHKQRAGASNTGQTAEAVRTQAARQVSQSLREVFRKLVSVLHPDREPDAQQRERKNRLMQRVNQAYEANDLLTLLGLQLEIAQIDAKQLSSSERLGQYNEVLREQLTDLEAQVNSMRHVYLPLMGGHPAGGLSVQAVDRQLTQEIAKVQGALRQLIDDLRKFRDPKQLRARLDEEAQARANQMNAVEMLMAMEAIQGLAAAYAEPDTGRPPKRRKPRKRR